MTSRSLTGTELSREFFDDLVGPLLGWAALIVATAVIIIGVTLLTK